MTKAVRLVACSLILFCSTSRLSIAAQELRISHQFHPQDDSRGRAVNVFVAEVMRRAPELKFSIYPQLSTGMTRDDQLDALQEGSLDFAVLPFIVPTKKVPELSLALLPGLVRSLADARALKGSQVHTKLQNVAAAHGLRIVTWWWMLGGFATTTRGAALSPTAVVSLKFQSCGLMQDLLVHAGAQPSGESAAEAPMLLEMGALDGVAVPYEEFIAFRLHEHAKLATFGNPSLVTCFAPLLVSKRTWDALTSEQKTAVEQAAAASNLYFDELQRDVEQRALAAFRLAGSQVRNLTPEEYADWLQLARETVWTRYANGSPVSRDLLNAALNALPTDRGNSAAGDQSGSVGIESLER